MKITPLIAGCFCLMFAYGEMTIADNPFHREPHFKPGKMAAPPLWQSAIPATTLVSLAGMAFYGAFKR